MSKQISARPARFQGRLNLLITAVLGLVILLMVNYLGFRHYWRKDLSQSGYYDLAPKTIDLLKRLPGPVNVIMFLDAQSGLKQQIDNLLREYQYRSHGKITVQRIDPVMDFAQAERLAKKYDFVKGENLVIFEYADRNKYLNDYNLADYDNSGMMMGQPARLKAFKGEQQFTSTIQALVEGKPAKVYFLTGHGERDVADRTGPRGFGEIDARIKRENIVTATLNLIEQPEVPADADALIVAGAKAPLSAAEVQTISKYLEEKGKLVVLQDPQSVSGLEPLIQKYGLTLQNDVVVAKARIFGQETLIDKAAGSTFSDHPAAKLLQGYTLLMPYTRSVGVENGPDGLANAKVTKLVQTPTGYWGEMNLADDKPVFDPKTDVTGPLTLAALYDAGGIQGEASVPSTRILVIGSSSFLTNGNIDALGVDFLTNALNWMVKKDVAIGINPKAPMEYPIRLTPLETRTIVIFALGLVPGVAFLLAGLVWIRRRK
jgi:ABC-type uncharacterized transport system involved in gliding motility auxiliary subunit